MTARSLTTPDAPWPRPAAAHASPPLRVAPRRRAVAPRVRLAVLASAFGLTAAACGGDPCRDLLEIQCEAAGPALCEEIRAARAARPDDDARRRACQRVLDDPAALQANIDALRVVGATRAAAPPPAAAAPAGDGDGPAP